MFSYLTCFIINIAFCDASGQYHALQNELDFLDSDKVVEVLTPYTYEGGVYLLQRESSPPGLSVEQFVY